MIWITFIAFVLLMLVLDLGVFHRKAHVVSVKEALVWSAVWLFMGLSFSVFVYFAYNGQWRVDLEVPVFVQGPTTNEPSAPRAP